MLIKEKSINYSFVQLSMCNKFLDSLRGRFLVPEMERGTVPRSTPFHLSESSVRRGIETKDNSS